MRRTLSFLGLALLAVVFMGQGCLRLGGSTDNGATGPAGVFVSVDKADTWTAADKLPAADGTKSINGVSTYRLVVDPHDPNTLYLATREHGLLFTYNGGKTWQQPADSNLTSGFVYDIVVHPKDMCTIYAATASQVYKSINCSRTWTEVYRELRPDVRIASLDVSNSAPYSVLLGESNGDLLSSADVGTTWNVLSRFKGSELTTVHFDPYQAGVMYVASKNNGLFRSNDNGVNWTSLKQTMSSFTKALEFRRFQLHPDKAGVLYWISTYGILESTDSGDTWTPVNLITQPGSVNIYSFSINPANNNEMYYTATIASSNRSTLYKSLDGGQTWTTKKLPTDQIPVAMYVHPENERLYVGFTALPKK